MPRSGQAEEFAIDKPQGGAEDGMLVFKFSLKVGRIASSFDYAVTGGQKGGQKRKVVAENVRYIYTVGPMASGRQGRIIVLLAKVSGVSYWIVLSTVWN